MPGEETTLEYLLKLVFERSDNTAANVLIDLVDRENVNKNIIVANGWSGSEITRKFLPARNEPPQYQEAGPTRTCARHLAEFLFNVESKTLVNERVSQELQDYLHLFSRRGHTGLYIPEFKDYYTKGGWFETSLYSESIWRGLKSAVQNGRAINRWRAAAGVVTGEHSHYVIGLLSLVKVPWPWNYFPMKKFSKKIYRVMESQRA